MVFIWKILLVVSYSVLKCAFMLHKGIFIEDTLNIFSKWLCVYVNTEIVNFHHLVGPQSPLATLDILYVVGRLAEV
jgi:hypothetical protein